MLVWDIIAKPKTMLTDLTLHELASNGDVKQIEACVKLGKTESINEQDEEYGFRMPLHIAAQIGRGIARVV